MTTLIFSNHLMVLRFNRSRVLLGVAIQLLENLEALQILANQEPWKLSTLRSGAFLEHRSGTLECWKMLEGWGSCAP